MERISIAERSLFVVAQGLVVGAAGILLGLTVLHIFDFSSQWALMILLGALCPFLIMIVGNVRKALIGIILLDIPFQLDISIGYYRDNMNLGALIGYMISATTMCVIALYILWLADHHEDRNPRTRTGYSAALALTLYISITCISTLAAKDVTLSKYELFFLLQLFLFYLYIVFCIRDLNDLLFVVVLLFTGLILESALMLSLRISGQSFKIAGISGYIATSSHAAGSAYRVGGTFGSPNVAGSYLSLLLAPALGAMFTPLRKSLKWLAACAFTLGTVALILTFSRGAWLAFIISCTILCLTAWKQGWLSGKITAAMFSLVIPIILLFYSPISSRILGDDQGSAASRIPQYSLAFRIIAENPILGVGANNYTAAMREYITQDIANSLFYWAVHNKYLLVWAEIGSLGLLAFIGFLLLTIKQGWHISRSGNPVLAPLALGFTAAIIGQMAHMFFDIFHSRSQVQLLWLIAGLILAISRMQADSKHGSEIDELHD